MAAPFRLYDTLRRKVAPFEPLRPGEVGIYACGMTVYDYMHVGHARAFIVFDSFVRYLRARGWKVTFVRNFTDVDDKIIRRANELGEDPIALAARFIDEFQADCDSLGLAAPDSEPKVSDCIDDIVTMIAALIEKGKAYPNEGSVWFSVTGFAEYGKLSGQRLDKLRSTDEGLGKNHPADFALWKAAKPGEPAWDSPWGPGRPGWHIECSAMAAKILGPTVDIHGGGLDLVFPHHENEVAQSECVHGEIYARNWMHNGLLTLSSGQKMGKSLGNVINVRDALLDFPAEAVRIYYLQNHYRSPLPWSAEALPDALGMLARLYDARESAESMQGTEPAEKVASDLGDDAQRVLDLSRGFEEKFFAALDDDFSTPMALGAVFGVVRAVNRFANHKKSKKRGGPIAKEALAVFEIVRESLGLFQLTTADFQAEVRSKRLSSLGLKAEDVEAKLAERERARVDKDWAKADLIRDDLLAQNVVVMDGAEGVEWRLNLLTSTEED
ncbi:MAG: cysteine--tRNA ligase [Planctomycetota bacterium]